MTPEEMLETLNEYGDESGSDFNDGDLNGWFGWGVEDGTLTVTYEPSEGDGPGPAQTAKWKLVAVSEL